MKTTPLRLMAIVLAWIATVLIEVTLLLVAGQNAFVFSPEGMGTNLTLYWGVSLAIIATAFYGPVVTALALSKEELEL